MPEYSKVFSILHRQIEDSSNKAAEYAAKISRISVRLRDYDQAADALRREICLNQQTESYQAIGRLAVALVLVQLAREDSVAAEKAFKEWGNCCDPNEVQTLEMLLQAFDDEDPDLAKRALSSPFIKHMDIEYARLARDLPLPKGLVQVPRANVIENAAPSYKSPNAPETSNQSESSSATGDAKSSATTEAAAAEDPSEPSVSRPVDEEEDDDPEEDGLC